MREPFYVVAILEGNSAAGMFVSGLVGTPVPSTLGEWRLVNSSEQAERFIKGAAEYAQAELEKLGFKTELLPAMK
jgi:hypothetical protein